MPRVTKPAAQESQKAVAPTWKIELPINRPCQIYPRVSTPEQKKNVSAEMQQDKSFTVSCGWVDDGNQIILDSRDLGLSGQLRMEDRPAFRDLLRRIENNGISAVVACNVDRLFRNKWGDESGKFMEICHRYNVLVVTPDFVYDFRISWHIERFRRRCEEAWNYLEYHIYGRMLKAQEIRGFAGYWTGRSIPLGYIVDRRETIDGVKNPLYLKYVPYEPHAAVIRWVFHRCKQLNCCIEALLREIEAKGYLFPDFDERVEQAVRNQFHHCTKVLGGYTIASHTGLRHLLMNVAYIGYWVYKDELISTANHEPIVNFETFSFVYTHLSATKLDGTPNEEVLERRRRTYTKRHVPDRPALLKNCIQSKDPECRIFNRQLRTSDGMHVYYGFYSRGLGGHFQVAKGLIPAGALDHVVLEQLKHRMRTPQAEKDLNDFLAYEEKTVQEASETLKSIDRDIIATRALLERLENQASQGKLTDPDLAQKANDSYAASKRELARLEAKRQEEEQVTREDQERRNYKQLMQDVGDAWDEVVLPEEHPRLVYLFIKSVTLEYLSPQFFSLIIQWRDPMWEIDQAVCYRTNKASVDWTAQEKAVLQEQYPDAPWKTLIEALPRRSFVAIKDQATRELGLQSYQPKVWDVAMPKNICWEDWHFMQQYGISAEQMRSEGGVKIVAWSLRRADIR